MVDLGERPAEVERRLYEGIGELRLVARPDDKQNLFLLVFLSNVRWLLQKVECVPVQRALAV